MLGLQMYASKFDFLQCRMALGARALQASADESSRRAQQEPTGRCPLPDCTEDSGLQVPAGSHLLHRLGHWGANCSQRGHFQARSQGCLCHRQWPQSVTAGYSLTGLELLQEGVSLNYLYNLFQYFTPRRGQPGSSSPYLTYISLAEMYTRLAVETGITKARS